MNIIFAHFDDIVVPLLVEWLAIVDVVRLDSACSLSRRNRVSLHRIFALPQVAFQHVQRTTNCFDHMGYLHWLLCRVIKLVEIVITADMDADSKKLVEKYITVCGSAVRHLEFAFYDSKIMSAATKHCRSLKRLSIDGGNDIESNAVLYSDSVETFYLSNEYFDMSDNICVNFPNLKDLTLVQSYINDAVLISTVQHSPKLQKLKLAEEEELTAASYAAIGQHCKHLERFTVSCMPFSSAHLASILPFTPHLTELSLCHTSGEVEARVVFETLAFHCPNLTELSLGENDAAPCAAILNAFTAMLTNCAHLHTLTLEGCQFVTDDFLLAIASKAKQIANIHLPDCNISNTGLAHVAKHCTDLDWVSLSVGGEYAATKDCVTLFRKETKVRIINVDDLYGYSGGVSVSVGGSGVPVEEGNDSNIDIHDDETSSIDPDAMDVSDG